MKTVPNIDERVTHYIDDVSDQIKTNLPTYRTMFIISCSAALGKNRNETIDLFDLAMKIKKAPVDLELEDAEFKLLKSECDQNVGQWVAFLHAQLLRKLDISEKIEKNPKVI